MALKAENLLLSCSLSYFCVSIILCVIIPLQRLQQRAAAKMEDNKSEKKAASATYSFSDARWEVRNLGIKAITDEVSKAEAKSAMLVKLGAKVRKEKLMCHVLIQRI